MYGSQRQPALSSESSGEFQLQIQNGIWVCNNTKVLSSISTCLLLIETRVQFRRGHWLGSNAKSQGGCISRHNTGKAIKAGLQYKLSTCTPKYILHQSSSVNTAHRHGTAKTQPLITLCYTVQHTLTGKGGEFWLRPLRFSLPTYQGKCTAK